MGASDYMVGNAPQGASYAAPNMGAQFGQMIAGMPEDYSKGIDLQRKIALQNAFPNGIPTRTDGTADTSAIMSTMAKLGGGQYIQGLMPYLINAEASRGIGNDLNSIDTYARTGAAPHDANTGPATSPSAAGPANLTPSQPQQPQAQGGRATTVMQALAAGGIPNDQLDAAATSVASQLGVGKTDPIDLSDPHVRNVLGPAIAQLKRNGLGQVVQNGQQPGQPAQQPVPAVATPASEVPKPPLQKTGQLSAGPPFAPNPQQQPQQPQPQQPSQQPQQPQPQLDALQAQMQRLRLAAGLSRQAEARAVAAGNIPAQQAAQAAAKSYDDQAGAIQENLFKMQQQAQEGGIKEGESTPEEKNARNPNVAKFELTKEQNKLDAVRFDKVATGIQGAADAADHILPHLQLARSLMNQPSFYSGANENTNLTYKRFLAAFGQDPNVAMPQEAFRKVMAANILDQVANLKAETAASGGGGRIFQSQIQLMEKAAQNPDNSIASNRLLTEIGFRMAQRAKEVDAMSNQYGHLDRAFIQKLRQYNDSHPVFTSKELEDPRRIAPPEFKSWTDAFHAKLPDGTPVKVGDVIRYFHAKGAS